MINHIPGYRQANRGTEGIGRIFDSLLQTRIEIKSLTI